MGLYNPNELCIIGPEWYASRRGVTVLDSDLKAIGYILTASTSDEIEFFWTWLQQSSIDYSVINVEVFDITDGDVELDTIQSFTYYPGGDLFVGAKPWTPGSFLTGGTSLIGPYYESINSPTLTPGIWPNSGQPVNNDEFVFNFYGYGFDFAVTFEGVAGTQDDRWITRVRQRFVCAQYLALGAEGAFDIQPYMWINGTKCTGPHYSVSAGDGVVELYHDWYYQPLIGSPWTPADIDRFDTTYPGPGPGAPYWEGQNGMGWIVQPTGSANNLATILQGQMIVDSAPTDPRLAIGSTIFPPNAQAWKAVALRDKADFSATTLTLVPGDKYLFLVRRGNSMGPIAPSFLASVDGEPIPGSPLWKSSIPKLDSSTRRPVKTGDERPEAYGVFLEAVDGSASDDSQPFDGVSAPNGTSDDYPKLGTYIDAPRINDETVLRQRFSAVDTNEYGWIWAVVSRLPSDGLNSLTISIHDYATDVVVGTPVEITTEQLKYPNRWYKIGVRLPDPLPTLTAGGGLYYMQFTSDASPASSWVVQLMRIDPISNVETVELLPTWKALPSPFPTLWNSLDSVRYGTPALVDAMDGTTLRLYSRVVATIATIPVWEGDGAELAVEATEEVCNFSYVNLTWSVFVEPEDACVAFGWYEIERSYDQVNWDLIARIDSIEVAAAADVEMRANTTVYYRIRAVRSDGAPTDWSDIVSTLAPMSGPGLSFTSNAAPELTVGYQDIGQQREFNFPENVEAFQPQGQDFQVFYREIEDRGVTFNAKLRIRAGREACLPLCDEDTENLFGDDVFGPLKAICRAGIPYVCVRNESGNVWYAFVTTPTGQWIQHGMEINGGSGIYTMDIEVSQVTTEPEPFNITPEP